MPRLIPYLTAATGMAFVGGSVAVSGSLADAPLFTVQALRYAVACLLLAGYARRRRIPVLRPRGSDWFWLTGIARPAWSCSTWRWSRAPATPNPPCSG